MVKSLRQRRKSEFLQPKVTCKTTTNNSVKRRKIQLHLLKEQEIMEGSQTFRGIFKNS